MKQILILLLLASCQQAVKPKQSEKKKYFIHIERKSQSIFTGGYENETHVDSIFAETDSAAYWEGVKSFTAEQMADKLIKDNGKQSPYSALRFDVLDRDKISILPAIPDELKQKAREFINSHK